MRLRSGFAWVVSAAASIILASACGSGQTHTTRGTSTTSAPSELSWLQVLPFGTHVRTPAGTVGIATPEYPVDIVPVQKSVWVFPHHIQLAYRVDPTKNRVIAVADVGDASCTSAATGDGLLWTSNCGSGANQPARVYGIDPVKARVTIRVRGTFPAFGDRSLWVLDDSGKGLRRVDPRTGVVVARISTHSDQQPGGGTLAVGGVGYGSVWLDSDADKTVERISTSTNKLAAVIPLVGAVTQDEAFPNASPSGYIDGAQMAFLDGKAWLGNSAGLFEINARTNRAKLIRLRMRPFTAWGDIAVVAGSGSIWVRTADTRIDRVDPTTGKLVGIYRGGYGGGGLAVAFGSLWVENAGADSVWREPIKPG
jgi:hypothetical protein